MKAVLDRVKISPQPRNIFKQAKSTFIKISFDCYKASSFFKKSEHTGPDYRVTVNGLSDTVPDSAMLQRILHQTQDTSPLLFAVVNGGTVTFVTPCLTLLCSSGSYTK